MSSARNFKLFVTGTPGSGKSRLLGTFARKFPRRLVFDTMGEHMGEIPGAVEAWTLGETVDALRRARARGDRWTVVTGMDDDDVPALVDVLMPHGQRARAGFSRAVGGMVVESGEIDTLAPNHEGISREVKGMWKRGRHHWLSILAATQRAGECHRVVSSLSDVVCAFRQHEPRDVAYLASLMGRGGVDAERWLTTLPLYSYLRYWPQLGPLEVVDAAGNARQLHAGELPAVRAPWLSP